MNSTIKHDLREYFRSKREENVVFNTCTYQGSDRSKAQHDSSSSNTQNLTIKPSNQTSNGHDRPRSLQSLIMSDTCHLKFWMDIYYAILGRGYCTMFSQNTSTIGRPALRTWEGDKFPLWSLWRQQQINLFGAISGRSHIGHCSGFCPQRNWFGADLNWNQNMEKPLKSIWTEAVLVKNAKLKMVHRLQPTRIPRENMNLKRFRV